MNEHEESQNLLPVQQSVHKRKLTYGRPEHGTNAGDCSLGKINTSEVTSFMSSPLSHKTRPNVTCLICSSCSLLKTFGFSYQNLKPNLMLCYNTE